MYTDYLKTLFIDEAKPAMMRHAASGYEDGYDDGVQDGEESGKELGRQEEYNRFWDAYQKNGNPSMWNYAFYGTSWNDQTFHPKYDVVNSGVNGLLSTFSYSRMTAIPVTVSGVDTKWQGTFEQCTTLETISKMVVSEAATYYSPFKGCGALKNLTVEGVIGKSGFNVSESPLLTHDSLLSIINALQDKTGESGTWTVTLGDTNLAKLTESEISIAEAKGWVLA